MQPNHYIFSHLPNVCVRQRINVKKKSVIDRQTMRKKSVKSNRLLPPCALKFHLPNGSCLCFSFFWEKNRIRPQPKYEMFSFKRRICSVIDARFAFTRAWNATYNEEGKKINYADINWQAKSHFVILFIFVLFTFTI